MFAQSATVQQIILWGSVIYFFMLGAWGVLYAYTPEMYPTAVRATGSGCASFSGRIGAVLAPYGVGAMISFLGQAAAYPVIFALIAAVCLLTALAMIVLGIETKGKTWDELAEL
ncbi:MAG: Major facilitator superfamily MFS_1 [Moorella sp. 60_41]|nr:MAG: Major facilitator superfamily MFS_1 [Moorella sp. 60_41]